MTDRPALAVFVKTPRLSPVKTRLAAAVGQAEAERFYELCLNAAEAVAQAAVAQCGVRPYWAVAEPAAADHPRWQAFERIPQGDGGLGDRLDRVYRTLGQRHRVVLLVGADAPTLSPAAIKAAIGAVTDPATPFALARSSDGGYALFAGARPLPPDVWLGVPYSCGRTADVFLERLRPFGDGRELDSLDDVDTADDLGRLALTETGPLLPQQAAVIDFARRLLG